MNQPTNDSDTTIQELKDLVVAFRDERDWKKHHTPKNLAMSISIEAAELMELFQWDDYTKRDHDKISDELSDILAYCFNFADVMDIDIASAYRSKLERAAQKYPTELFSKDKDGPDDYDRIKQSYRQQPKE